MRVRPRRKNNEDPDEWYDPEVQYAPSMLGDISQLTEHPKKKIKKRPNWVFS